MGLFNRKKKEEQTKRVNSTETEFDRDIRDLLARDDIQSRPEICDVELR